MQYKTANWPRKLILTQDHILESDDVTTYCGVKRPHKPVDPANYVGATTLTDHADATALRASNNDPDQNLIICKRCLAALSNRDSAIQKNHGDFRTVKRS